MEPKPYKPAVRELAARIFTELIKADAEATHPGAARVHAQDVARLSFDLAEAFQAVEDQLNTPSVNNSAFKLEASDIAEWTRK